MAGTYYLKFREILRDLIPLPVRMSLYQETAVTCDRTIAQQT